jgi:hypothetical protein
MLDCRPMIDRGRTQGWRTAIWLAAGLVALGFLERGAHLLVSRRLPTAGAQWIWADGAPERREPVAFYAVRDFELQAPPASALAHVLADEAYVFYLNGRRVGSGGYYAGAPLDTYRIDRLLRPGWNRVAIELRSGRGAGGLLCVVFADGEREPLLRSDREWRIFRDAAGVVDGMRPVSDGLPALVWQSAPTGAWGLPRFAPERPLYDRAVVVADGHLAPELLEPRTEPRPTTEVGAPLVSDFGRAVTGYVLLRGLAATPRRLLIEVGLDRVGSERFDVLLADGQDTWSTAEVRRLRYVGAPYLPEGATLGVVEVGPALASLDAERIARRRDGVFGVEPPKHEPHNER